MSKTASIDKMERSFGRARSRAFRLSRVFGLSLSSDSILPRKSMMLVISSVLGYFLSLPFAAVLQSGNYRVFALRRAKKPLIACAVYAIVFSSFALTIVFLCGAVLKVLFGLLLYLATAVFIVVVYRKMHISLHFTNRLIRLLICELFLYVIIFFSLFFTRFRLLWASTPTLMPFVLCVADWLLGPAERKNNERYVTRAKEKLAEMRAIRVGITGSYGKTTVKNDLEQLLSVQYDTLASPSNYNTPLGIAKTLSTATGREEVLLLEMGARRTGDIRELCEMINPQYGILTGIAPQHLETFGSEEAIMSEKNVLAECVSKENVVFYNLTDPKVRILYESRVGKKIGVGYEDSDYLISTPILSESGSRFFLSKGRIGREIVIPSVGISAVVDFALAAAVALELGLSWDNVLSVGHRIYPTPHRFEIVKRGEVTVIDDSYNINPIGAATALESLKCFVGKRKIVYASGMVELGEREEALNRALGEKIAETATEAVVCEGRYGDQVAAGIIGRRDMPIYRVRDTAEATALFGSILRKGDVLLLMSDLPRDYLL